MEKKYQTVYDIDEANKLVELGYKLHTFFAAPVEHDMVQECYVMSLQDQSKYDDIDKYRSFPITGEEQTLPEGWTIIHHTSKELIGVTKHDGNRGV